MPWSGAGNAGFSSGDPWLPLAADFTACNVEKQLGDATSLLSFYRRMIWYRKGSAALLHGHYRALESPPDTFVYLREAPSQRVLVALNFSAEARVLRLPQDGEVAVSTHPARAGRVAGSIELYPNEGLVLAQ
jgi:alpha-glucosidase